MSADLILYFPADSVPESVFAGIYNNVSGTTWYCNFPWWQYDKIEAAWKVMNAQPKLWVGLDTEAAVLRIGELVGASDSKRLDESLIAAITAAYASLPPSAATKLAAAFTEALEAHLGQRVIAVYE